MNFIEIDWNGPNSRPGYKASTIHGWLVKMRGTLIGSESIRQAGRREMKEARAIRAYRRQREKGKTSPASTHGGFHLIPSSKKPPPPPRRGGDRHAVPLPRRDTTRSHHRHHSERDARPQGPSRHQSGRSGRSGVSSKPRGPPAGPTRAADLRSM
ncbi:hypothetical protein FA95DRAFT_1592095 [Auriscalpium vulgare]|uniref:Uncharacterized protein n=1 Tax=Auriscalpium vulgare TaxID=40419 RepID=A0ACB8SD25_9AGAM|nr:hypothetical protein FA95DRAFT_1592095 [Auriscalpium vulgare]